MCLQGGGVGGGPSHGKSESYLKPGKPWALLALGAGRMPLPQLLQLSCFQPEDAVNFEA